MDARIEEVVLALMEPWRKGAGQFVDDVVRGWESRTVVDRVELAVGRDLQYIRVNGTAEGAVDRKSVVEGKSVSVRVDPGGSRILKKKNTIASVSTPDRQNKPYH